MTLQQKSRLIALLLMGAELAYLARQRHWQHVHVHSCGDAANIALFAHALSRIPYSLTLHGPLRDYGPNQRQKWGHAQFGIVITQKLFHELQEHLGPHLPAVKVAPMGVNVEVFSRQDPYQPWSGEEVCRIFSCGRLNPCKGHHDLIEAVHQLHQQGIPVHLTIAGEDEQGGQGYHQTLQAQIDRLGLGSLVTLLGAVSENQVREHLTAAHVFVLASLHEPLGVAIMEAMAMEVPVVVTQAGGVKELVHHEQDGLLVDPAAPDQIVKAVQRILNTPELALRLGQTGRATVKHQFHVQRSADMLLAGMGLQGLQDLRQ